MTKRMNKEILPYRFTKRAAKELKKIKKSDKALFLKIEEAIIKIRKNPNIGTVKKGDLKGYLFLDIYHSRSNYELCYALIEDEVDEVVLIVLIGTRENFYSDLKRYLNK